MDSITRKCSGCRAYVQDTQLCHRYPEIVEKTQDDWCLEYEEKEVIPCPVKERKVKKDEKEKANNLNVEDDQGLIVKKRGAKWRESTKKT